MNFISTFERGQDLFCKYSQKYKFLSQKKETEKDHIGFLGSYPLNADLPLTTHAAGKDRQESELNSFFLLSQFDKAHRMI